MGLIWLRHGISEDVTHAVVGWPRKKPKQYSTTNTNSKPLPKNGGKDRGSPEGRIGGLSQQTVTQMR